MAASADASVVIANMRAFWAVVSPYVVENERIKAP